MSRVLPLGFCVFAITSGEFVAAGLLPVVAGDLDVSPGVAGLIVTAYALGMIIGGPILTALVARIDRQHVLLGLLAVALVGNIASAVASTFSMLLGARFVSGLVTSTFFAHALVIAVEHGPPDRAATTVSRLTLGMNLAMVVGAPAGTVLGGLGGWRVTYALIAAGCAVGFLWIALRVPRQPVQRRGSALTELWALRDPRVVRALATTAVANCGALMVFVFLGPFLGRVAGVAGDQLPAVILTFGLGGVAGNLIGGRLFDRHGRGYQVAALTTLAFVLVLFWVAVAVPWVGLVMTGVLGAASFSVIPGMQATVMAAAAKAPTLSLAVNASGYQVAAFSAGIVGGAIVDSATGPRPLPVVGAILTLAGLALYVTGAAARATTQEASRADGHARPPRPGA